MIERRRKVRDDYLNGIWSQQELAIRHGVTIGTICTDLAVIRPELKIADPEEAKIHKDMQERRLNNILANAVSGYQRSRQDAEEITIAYERRKCRSCNGTGWQDANEESGEWCENCNGDGERVVEVMTRRVKGQAGDSSFLRTQLEVVKEINRINGNYPERTKKVEHKHVHAQIDLSRASSEDLLAAMEIVDVLRRSEVKQIESEVVGYNEDK